MVGRAAADRHRPVDEKALKAKELQAIAAKHYNLGDYDRAIDELKQSYELVGLPGLLFNIAQAYRMKGDCTQAALFYKSYLRERPSEPNAEQIRARILEMEQCARDKTPPPPAPEAPA